MAKIESIANKFVEKWAEEDSAEEFKESLIDMIADIHKEYIVASIRNEVCGKSLDSQYESVMEEFKSLKKQINMYKKESLSNIEKTKKELSEQLEASTKKKTSVSKASLGPYSSKQAKEFAEENNIDPNTVVGTGKGDKITKTDLKKALKLRDGSSSGGKKSSGKKSATDSKKFCNGTTANGAPCNSSGKVNIKGKWFCNRHKDQAQKCENLEDDDKFEDYSDNSNIDRFRNSSMKSIETIDEKDRSLNDLMGSDEEKESMFHEDFNCEELEDIDEDDDEIEGSPKMLEEYDNEESEESDYE